MFFKTRPTPEMDHNGKVLEMLHRTQAVIQFKPDGTIITANDNFLSAMGYRLDEVAGKKHAMFVDAHYAQSAEYKGFWKRLASGEHFTDQFARLKKSGQVIWIQATYASLLDAAGQVETVIKIATDVTARRAYIDTMTDAINGLESGNLNARVPESDIPDLALIAGAFNRAVSKLNITILSVKGLATEFSGTAGEISSASTDLAHRTERQAATLQETSTAMEHLMGTVRTSAKTARNVEGIVCSARQNIEESGGVVAQAINAMDLIEESSGKIARIISVIEDIAFQTNLLALNAGVEAARAGDAGRGFAVVAYEVRALAKRSSDASQEIKSLIANSSQHVGNGVKMVGQAGEQLRKIIDNVGTISTNVSEITRSAEAQVVTLHEINAGVLDLDQVTQQNAAMVEQTNAASVSLATGAKELSNRMSVFTTTQTREAPTAEVMAFRRAVG